MPVTSEAVLTGRVILELLEVPPSRLQGATGLSVSACSRVRSGAVGRIFDMGCARGWLIHTCKAGEAGLMRRHASTARPEG
jgi:hypothetical protein